MGVKRASGSFRGVPGMFQKISENFRGIQGGFRGISRGSFGEFKGFQGISGVSKVYTVPVSRRFPF